MNRTIVISLLTFSLSTSIYADEHKTSIQILQNALIEMKAVVDRTLPNTTETVATEESNATETVATEESNESNATETTTTKKLEDSNVTEEEGFFSNLFK